MVFFKYKYLKMLTFTLTNALILAADELTNAITRVIPLTT
jgi:hypothetical protein